MFHLWFLPFVLNMTHYCHLVVKYYFKGYLLYIQSDSYHRKITIISSRYLLMEIANVYSYVWNKSCSCTKNIFMALTSDTCFMMQDSI